MAKSMKKGTVESKVPKSLARVLTDRLERRLVPTEIVAVKPEFIPKYQTKGAACCDLYAYLPNGPLQIGPGHTELIDTGIAIRLVPGYEAQIRARSGLARQGITVTNAWEEPGGTIDEDYRQHIKVIVTNMGRAIIRIENGDRIAQMALKPVWYFDWNPVEQFDSEQGNDRTGGFGSTGVR